MQTFDIGVPVLDIHPTGSNYICDPPVTTTDIDYIVLVPPESISKLSEGYKGWFTGGSIRRDEDGDIIMGSNFVSLKREQDNVNLIITDDPEYYGRWVTATKLAKRFNLLKKPDRIACFTAVLDGVYDDNS